MSGPLKKILIGLVVIIIVVFGGLKFYGADLVKNSVQTYGPQYTGTSVSIEDLSFSPIAGNFGIMGFLVGNPEGFEGEKAFSLKDVRVRMDTMSLFSDVVKVQEIHITEPEFLVEWKGGKLNSKVILEHLEQFSGEEESENRVIIDDVYITGGKITVQGLPVDEANQSLELPDIHIRDIGGTEGEGTTFSQASQTIMTAVTGTLTKVIAENNIRGLLGGVTDKIKEQGGSVGEKIKSLFGGGDDEEEDGEEENGEN